MKLLTMTATTRQPIAAITGLRYLLGQYQAMDQVERELTFALNNAHGFDVTDVTERTRKAPGGAVLDRDVNSATHTNIQPEDLRAFFDAHVLPEMEHAFPNALTHLSFRELSDEERFEFVITAYRIPRDAAAAYATALGIGNHAWHLVDIMQIVREHRRRLDERKQESAAKLRRLLKEAPRDGPHALPPELDLEADTYRAALRILGLTPMCSERAAKRAYLALIRAEHPDQGGSAKAAQRINAAYDLVRAERGWL